MYNSLLNLCFSRHTKTIAFADDILLLTTGHTPTEAEVYANADLTKIEKWARDNKILFNDSKSKAMLITRKRKPKQINIYLNNRKLAIVEHIKYLGIHFDHKLSFDNHIDNIARKSTTLIHMLGRTAKLTWGLGHKSLKTIYEGAIIPMIVYGAPVWGDALNKLANLRKLQRVQRLINIKMIKGYRTISFDTSCVIAGVPPIGVLIEEKIQLYRKKHNLERRKLDYKTPNPPKKMASFISTSEDKRQN
mgnify:FL=1